MHKVRQGALYCKIREERAYWGGETHSGGIRYALLGVGIPLLYVSLLYISVNMFICYIV
ncbi:hypothetical protein [Pseudomonas phage pPA-3099-2aT.3]|nr:hypothetical protein [Pseudomonas phage pPA-3099-2aT.3]